MQNYEKDNFSSYCGLSVTIVASGENIGLS